MNNSTWACFDCREAVRRSEYSEFAVPCPQCGQNCRYMGDKIRLPAKRQAKAWKELLVDLQQRSSANTERQALRRLERMRAIQDEIKHLIDRGLNPGREKHVRSLRKELDELS